MAPFCFIFDVVFRNLVEEHKLAVGKDLTGKINYVREIQLFQIQRDQNDVRAAYDLFASNDMKHMTKVLGAIMEP